MHETVVTVLKMLLLAQPPQTHHQASLLMDDALVTAIHALHFAFYGLNYIINHDQWTCLLMRHVLNIPLFKDWHTILAYHKQLINHCTYEICINFHCTFGQKILKYDKILKVNLNQIPLSHLTFFVYSKSTVKIF